MIFRMFQSKSGKTTTQHVHSGINKSKTTNTNSPKGFKQTKTFKNGNTTTSTSVRNGKTKTRQYVTNGVTRRRTV